jgi:hypothetical protein
MTSSKNLLGSAVLAALALAPAVSRAEAVTSTSNFRTLGASAGLNTSDSCQFAGSFVTAATTHYAGNGQPDNDVTNINYGLSNSCTGIFASISGQTDYNPDPTLAPGVNQSTIQPSLRKATYNASFQANVFWSVYNPVLGGYEFHNCTVPGTITGNLNATDHATTTTSHYQQRFPGYFLNLQENGRRAPATGSYTITIAFTQDCSIPGVGSVISAPTTDFADIITDHVATLTVTRGE